jgi:hypothetical protein
VDDLAIFEGLAGADADIDAVRDIQHNRGCADCSVGVRDRKRTRECS